MALVAALPHLERVDVSDSCITDAGLAVLQRAYPTVIDVKPTYPKGSSISLGEPY